MVMKMKITSRTILASTISLILTRGSLIDRRAVRLQTMTIFAMLEFNKLANTIFQPTGQLVIFNRTLSWPIL